MSSGFFIFFLSLLIQAVNSIFGNKTPITLSQQDGSIVISIKTASSSAMPYLVSTNSANVKITNKKTTQLTPKLNNILN
jgi:hypothetical protein